MSRLAKKKFEYKKTGDFTVDESVNEYRRQLYERKRIKTLREKGLAGHTDTSNSNNSIAETDTYTSTKPSQKGWSKADYAINIRQEGVKKDRVQIGKYKTNQFERAPKCGTGITEQLSTDIFKDGLKTSRENKLKLSGSDAQEIITQITLSNKKSTTTTAAPTPEPLSPKPTRSNWNVDNYRIDIAQNNDNNEAPHMHKIKGSTTYDTFSRNQRCGDNFDLKDLQTSFRQSKLEARAIRQKTNGGNEARAILTQRGRVD